MIVDDVNPNDVREHQKKEGSQIWPLTGWILSVQNDKLDENKKHDIRVNEVV